MPLLQNTLRYSVNTWNSGFMDKLYAGTNPVGVITEILIALNLHVSSININRRLCFGEIIENK